jgi:hypothetical protein
VADAALPRGAGAAWVGGGPTLMLYNLFGQNNRALWAHEAALICNI